jgi:hypothetical protein
MSGNGPSAASGGRRAGTTYAHAAGSSRAAATQADFTWPLESKVPILVNELFGTVLMVAQPGSVTQTSQISDIEMITEGAVGGSFAAPPGGNAETVMKGSATAVSGGSVRVAAGSGSSDTSRGGGPSFGNDSAGAKTQNNQGVSHRN